MPSSPTPSTPRRVVVAVRDHAVHEHARQHRDCEREKLEEHREDPKAQDKSQMPNDLLNIAPHNLPPAGNRPEVIGRLRVRATPVNERLNCSIGTTAAHTLDQRSPHHLCAPAQRPQSARTPSGECCPYRDTAAPPAQASRARAIHTSAPPARAPVADTPSRARRSRRERRSRGHPYRRRRAPSRGRPRHNPRRRAAE